MDRWWQVRENIANCDDVSPWTAQSMLTHITELEAEIKRLNQILTDPQTLHLHILRNPEVLPANLLRHLLGTDKEGLDNA